MKNELPSPQEIEYFQVLKETCHITKSAQRLGLTQPTLSAALKRLEEKLDVSLFVRTKKGLEITPQGELFAVKSRDLLVSWSGIRTEIHSSTKLLKDYYDFGIHPSVAIICLPLSLPYLLKNYPSLNLKFHHGGSRLINEQIISKLIDFGVVVNPVKHPDLVLRKICDDEVKIFKIPESKSDTIIYDPNMFQSLYIINKLKKRKKSYKNFLELESLELIRELGLAGVGDVILPSRVANKPGMPNAFKEVTKSPIFKDEFYFVWNSTKQWNKTEKEFLRNFQLILKDKIS